ncbi:heme peroxidase [Basidiobolus meristosporus CBS 931.73]|uniref:Heme peroxidase n=1 Tax=Basidiobolus meristosporus CBS 931.73 TaxID=1314790 RepID=A0A1Y1X332_9FUNG|nr:heme peroxidase [Basidiobolus meristosporus CBS 931.73]|eukprot:ORX79734.1 heme peroxidase [Basidiobolus meristosporus CBS 931.73]
MLGLSIVNLGVYAVYFSVTIAAQIVLFGLTVLSKTVQFFISRDFIKYINALNEFLQLPPSDVVGTLKFGFQEVVSPKSKPMDDRSIPFERLMQIVAKLPQNDPASIGIQRKLIQQFWDDLQKPQYVFPEYGYREADGSNNSVIYPNMGKANTPYARSVTSKRIRLTDNYLPAPDVLFDTLLDRGDKFVPHPFNINTLLFHLATLITHDLFHSSPTNPMINQATSYADLSVLYGDSKESQWSIRTGKKGLIRPDSFADRRVTFLLPGVGALLIVFSRNHNFIAQKLLEINQDNRFSANRGEDVQDEHLFQTARLINGACYANLILHNYVRCILGLPADTDFTLDPLMEPPKSDSRNGNAVSLEFNFVYRWHSALGEKDTRWLEESRINQQYREFKTEVSSIIKTTPPDEVHDKINSLLAQKLSVIDPGVKPEDIDKGLIIGLRRGPDDRYADADIVNLLKSSMDSVAGKLGAGMVPTSFKDVEIAGIMQSRMAGCCTLNEFRRYFNLKEYETFEEINPDPRIAKTLRALYRHPNNVELYPGIVVESTKTNGGISLPYTTSRAILADAVNLLRNDRFLTDEYNPARLTNWGYEYTVGTGSYNKRFHGSVFPRMLREAFPEQFKADDDPYLISPFYITKGRGKTA